MAKHLKISVVIPSFNQARFIQETLDSVVDQSYPNLELIVIDGGSTDESIDIIHQYSSYISYWVSEPDGGQTYGLVKGFKVASGDILCWLNSDDLLEKNTLEKVSKFFSENPEVDAVFGNTTWIDEFSEPIRVQKEIPFNRYIWLHTYNYIPGMSMFWRRDLYEKVGGLDTRFNLAMDADLWIRFAEVGKIAHVSDTWSRMRFYDDQKNRRLRAKSDQEDEVIRSRYIDTSNVLAYQANRFAAQTIRSLWKLALGYYPINYKRYMERRRQ